jgi:hypothetical protein
MDNLEMELKLLQAQQLLQLEKIRMQKEFMLGNFILFTSKKMEEYSPLDSTTFLKIILKIFSMVSWAMELLP